MLRKIFVEDAGETDLIAGSTVDMMKYNKQNKLAIEAGKKPAKGKKTLQGITKIALLTDSFLSAASFQETARVLTDAAVKGKVDKLLGLKENVIIGRLIPAGTGIVDMNRFELEGVCDTEIVPAKKDEDLIDVGDTEEEISSDSVTIDVKDDIVE